MTQRINVEGLSPEQVDDPMIKDVLETDQSSETSGDHVDGGYQKGYSPATAGTE